VRLVAFLFSTEFLNQKGSVRNLPTNDMTAYIAVVTRKNK
jgi:hypothetical protein